MDLDISTEAVRIAEGVIVAALIALGGVIVTTWRNGRRRDQQIKAMLEVFTGAPADPIRDIPASPGIVAQLNDLHALAHRLGEDAQARDQVIGDLARDVMTNNGGSTLRDTVDTLARTLTDLAQQVEQLLSGQKVTHEQINATRQQVEEVLSWAATHTDEGNALNQAIAATSRSLQTALAEHGITWQPAHIPAFTAPEDPEGQRHAHDH